MYHVLESRHAYALASKALHAFIVIITCLRQQKIAPAVICKVIVNSNCSSSMKAFNGFL